MKAPLTVQRLAEVISDAYIREQKTAERWQTAARAALEAIAATVDLPVDALVEQLSNPTPQGFAAVTPGGSASS